ncbi:DNA cytosine methyltransferase [Brevibacterium aurantiacum]|uniref:Cytosine-specific methyltransferase n=1 Tax=Brevibacterium aurantiacum TaxID=273384 RepID=A0A4Z0KIQ0_BREAU|nr:DNA (cytosine-5-)-methyltransferase [Brevibacterium aurantiacum]TGD38654.1 DNA (cytosine-5-)-methyltransferase [Brevibacterium aurantiacum]
MSLSGIELFAGGGGMLLGSASSGVNHVAAIEWDRWACDTLANNAQRDYPLVRNLDVIRGDVRDVNWRQFVGRNIDIISGGPPCQPFSLGGRARAADDPRDMFPAMTEAIANVQPRAFVVENVRGLTRTSFQDYFSYIRLRLEHPLLRERDGETWTEHLRRLEQVHTSSEDDLHYNVVVKLVNAADYGVPQHRHRVFIVGFRSDVQAQWSFPEPTHSGSSLLQSQLDGTYWSRHEVAGQQQINVERATGDPSLNPWMTVRDAIGDLPKPSRSNANQSLNHVLQPGARSYPGHTGSPIDSPAKTLKAGAHGVPGGENMIRFPNGRIRYFTIREAARMQTFPDDYALHGAWGEAMRQIGNAVPVRLAEQVMSSVANHLRFEGSAKVMKESTHSIKVA